MDQYSYGSVDKPRSHGLLSDKSEKSSRTRGKSSVWILTAFMIGLVWFLVIFLVDNNTPTSPTNSMSQNSDKDQKIPDFISGQFSNGEISLEEKTSKPHIIFLLIDDQGHHDMGYTNPEISSLTPNLDKLANSGVKLTNYYTESLCTPARAALLTGKYPIHTGMQHNIIDIHVPWGLPLNFTLLPQLLKDEYGYATRMVGKWHLGFYHPLFLPTSRGFDSHFGYYGGQEKYYTHLAFTNSPTEDELWWYDWHRDGHPSEIGTADNGYSLTLMGDEVDDILRNHDQREPLFLYYATQAAHTPLENPPEYYLTEENELQIQESLTPATYNTSNRAKFLRTEAALDVNVGRMVETLKEVGMYDNSIIVVASDNGGCASNGGENWPLRGGKNSLWEGGLKVNSFVHSPLLAEESWGTEFKHLFHVTDWVPTITNGILGDGSASGREYDGINQWDGIQNVDGSKYRQQILFNIEYFTDTDHFKCAYRLEGYKLLFGELSADIYSRYTPDDKDVCESMPQSNDNQTTQVYFIPEDPSESNDVVEDISDIHLSQLWSMIDSFWDSSIHSAYIRDEDDVWEKVWLDHGSYVVPWHHSLPYEERTHLLPPRDFSSNFTANVTGVRLLNGTAL